MPRYTSGLSLRTKNFISAPAFFRTKGGLKLVDDQDGDQQTIDRDTFTEYNEDDCLTEGLGVLGNSADGSGSSGSNGNTGADGSQTSYQSGSQEAHTLSIGAHDGGNSAGSFSEGNTRSGNSHGADAGQSEGAEVQGETVKYRLRYNVIKDDELKYQLAEDVRLKVKAVCYYKDGTKIEGEIGEEGGETKTLYYYDVKDAGELKALAREELERYRFDGYRGRIETFLAPYALPGMVAQLDDPVYRERGGNYYIESTEVTFGTGGARRKIEIGIKV